MSERRAPSLLSVFGSRKMAAILLLGFASGLPYYLTNKDLQAWMTLEKVDLKTIWGLEKGTRWPIARNLAAIARTLGLDAATLARIADGEPSQVA